MNGIDIETRLATAADAERIATVLHDSFVEYESLYTPEGFLATTLDTKGVQQRMQEGPVWVCLRGGKIVGTVGVIAENAESLYIRGMAVSPGARGHAVGIRLLREIEAYAHANGFKRLSLSTTPFLHRAIALYEHFGFRRPDDRIHDLFGTPLFTMEKEL